MCLLQGAIIAQIVGTAFIGWIAFGGLFHGKSANSSLPTSATECIALNSTTIYTTGQVTTTTLSTTSERWLKNFVLIEVL